MALFQRNTTKKHKTTKEFSYENKGITLKFSLNVDNILELSLFEGLLVEALNDVKSEIRRIAYTTNE